jgi:drug/metabolite transporter (DMT)-like permease
MELLGTTFFGVLSAITWGVGDLAGGAASRRSSVYSVVLYVFVVGAVVGTAVGLALGEATPSGPGMVFAALAGLSSAIALLALYRGIARGQTGTVAPLAAVIGAALPVSIALSRAGAPTLVQAAGLIVGLGAVGLVSRTSATREAKLRAMGLGVVAGLGFGGFFVLIDLASDEGVFLPLAIARVAALPLLLLVARAKEQLRRPQRAVLGLILIAGLFDLLGSSFFVLSAQYGRLDIAAILSSLYTAVTVLLAALVLRETMTRSQWVGVVGALVAVALLAG